MKKVLIPAAAVLMLLNACKKEETSDTPTITVEQPTGNHFDVGDTIIVKATAKDNEEMHSLDAFLISVEDNDTLWTARAHGHGKSLTLNNYYVVEEHEDGEHGHGEEVVNLVFVAENDAGKTATKTVPLEIHHH